jgi:uncharacterized protein
LQAGGKNIEAPFRQGGSVRIAPTMRAGLFVVLVLAFSLAGLLVSFPAFVAMWSPALAAIVVSLVTGRSLKAIGWRPGPAKWLVAAWIVPVALGFVAYGLLWLSGIGKVPNPTFLERARMTLGMDTGQADWLVIVAAFAFISILGLLPGMVMSLGEEIGWRGFLFPVLAERLGFARACLYSGGVWAVWHWPAILAGNYGTSSTALWYRLVCFTTMVLSAAVIMSWLRLRSGGIWAPAIMHATHNGTIQAFFERITAPTRLTDYFAGEFGIALAACNLFLAIYILMRIRATRPPIRR